MAQAGTIKTITGIVNARTPDGQVRQLMVGDMVYENEIIETTAGSEIGIELSNGKILALAESSQVVLDETVIAVVDQQDAVVTEAQELQAALEAGEELPEEEPAAGEEDEEHDFDLAYYAGDQSRGEVDSYLFGTEYGDEDEDFPDIEGEEEDTTIIEEPEPLFIVGSDPQNQQNGEYYDGYEGPYRPFQDDVENPVEDDYHTVNPAGDTVQGAILGQEGADVLVGDPGAVQENLNNNYILVMDTSYSMGNPDGGSTTRLADLQQATKDIIQEFYDKIESSTYGAVRINLLPFSSDAGAPAWISFTKSGDTVFVNNSLDDGDPLTDDMDEIYNWIDGLVAAGGTSYTDAFSAANVLVNPSYAQNDVIFISDGMPSEDEPHEPSLDALRLGLGTEGSIRVVGINMSPGDPILVNIDSEDDPANIEDADALSDVISNLATDLDLQPTGSDDIWGDDGNDLIFGDVLNTDGVFADIAGDYDLTGITEPADGSGWEVFATLEAELSSWTREDTIRYIQENHEDLAKETVLETGTDYGDVRYGGDDTIEGGDGDDIIYGQEGNDIIDAGAGDDVVDGGTGFDTLVVTNETELDFSNVSNIESIDLDEDGVAQNITLSLDQVLNMTDGDNRLEITGETGDSVTLTGVAGGEWTHDGNGLFTNVADNSIQINVPEVFDGETVDVDVDDGSSFQV